MFTNVRGMFEVLMDLLSFYQQLSILPTAASYNIGPDHSEMQPSDVHGF